MLISLRIVGSLSVEKREGLLRTLSSTFDAETHYDGMHSSVTDQKIAILCTLHDADTHTQRSVWDHIAGFVGDSLEKLSVGLATDPHGKALVTA